MNNKRVKIFIDGDVLVHEHFSGIGHYTADLLKALDKLLYKDEYSHVSVEIGVPYRNKHKLTKYGFENFGVRGIPLPSRMINGLKQRRRLPPIDLLFGKKVYVFPNYSSWPTIRKLSIPVIYDLSFIKYPEFVEPQNRKFLVDQVGLSVARASKIITISKNSLNEIVSYYKYPKKDIEILSPAVDMHKFYRRSQEEISYNKAKYGIFGEYILFVGNIEPRKNLITLLKAYDQLPNKVQEKYSLLLIGAKGWLDNEIRDYIIEMRKRGLRVIQPVEYVTDVDLPSLYSGATVFVYISRYEGFGIPPIEAMACGTPAITSDNSSLPEAVGNAAIKIDALDHNELSSQITRLIERSDARNDLINKGYAQIMNFDWTKSAIRLIEMSEDLLK
ncbi:MAG: glycosyltransferase family 1 protein [Candidatus Saccharibacteria bacterium]